MDLNAKSKSEQPRDSELEGVGAQQDDDENQEEDSEDQDRRADNPENHADLGVAAEHRIPAATIDGFHFLPADEPGEWTEETQQRDRRRETDQAKEWNKKAQYPSEGPDHTQDQSGGRLACLWIGLGWKGRFLRQRSSSLAKSPAMWVRPSRADPGYH